MIKTQQYAKASPPLPSPGTKVAVLMEMKVQREWKEKKKEGIKEGRWKGGKRRIQGLSKGGTPQKKVRPICSENLLCKGLWLLHLASGL